VVADVRGTGLVATLRNAAVVAVGTGLAAAMLVRFGLTAQGVIEAFVVVVLVRLSAIDIERHVLPNVIVLPSAAIVLVAQVAAFPDHALEWTLAAVGAAAFLLVPLFFYPTGMGMGDVKLTLLLGAALGWLIAPALLLAFVASALAALVLIARRGLAARKQAMPFGPFLAFGAIATLLLSVPGQS
jgi:leader peptidase (prepilin peptidase) / N-methyltransferase